MEFNAVFLYVKQQWQSDANDETILQKALALYWSHKGANFNFLHVWNIVKKSKNGKTSKLLKRLQVVLLKEPKLLKQHIVNYNSRILRYFIFLISGILGLPLHGGGTTTT